MKRIQKLVSLFCALAMLMAMNAFTVGVAETVFAGGSGTAEDPYQIATAEQLNAVINALSASYILTADIDLAGQVWSPIGVIEFDANDPTGEAPVLEKAFSGVFDGDGHTISNYSVAGSMCAGLFGVVAQGTVKDLTLKNAHVQGNVMSAAAIGYAWNTTVDNVDLVGGSSVTGVVENEQAPNMLAGIVGAGMDSSLKNCDVSGCTLTMNTLPDAAMLTSNAHDVGLLGGGLENCVLKACTVSDSSILVDGPYCFGIGGLSGCAMLAESVSNCSVTNVGVTVGEHAYLVGGMLGYTGRDGDALTDVTNCSASEVAITVGADSSRVGGLIGGGFYIEVYKDYFPNPTAFSLNDCAVSGTIAAKNSAAIGALIGCAYHCPVDENCESSLTLNSEAAPLIGEDAALTALSATYKPLFHGSIFESQYDAYWHDYTAAIVGADAADDMVAMLKTVVGANEGEQGENHFFCGFTNELDTITFEGNTISGAKDGKEVFSNEYRYVGTDGLYMGKTPVMPGFAIYESVDGSEDAYKYFFMAPDTPSETYHIEFRYGSDINQLTQYDTGDYAYWLAAGIPTDADEVLYEQVIALFCLENMDYSQRSDTSLAQMADFMGTWDCAVNDYPELVQFGITGLYFEIDEEGVGQTFTELNGSGEYIVTDSYQGYVYESDASAKSGVYVAHNPEEGETQGSHYVITEADGKTTLTLTTLDGEQITYTKR